MDAKPARIRVLLVDDHKLVREGLRSMLSLTPEVEVVGEASSGEEALRKVEQLLPDIVLMDVYLPVLSGIDATRLVRARFPAVEVVILTMYLDDKHAFEAIRAGASAYLVKTIGHEELVRTIQLVHAGEALLHPSVTKSVMKRFVSLTQKGGTDKRPVLTPKQSEILRALCDGASNKEIAQKLFLSEKTVKSHLRSIFRKLNVNDRTQAVVKALKDGLVE